MGKGLKVFLLTLVILTLCISTAGLTYLHFFGSGEDISGEWTANLDMTEQAAVAALCWLQDIEAVSVSLEDMEAYMQGLNIQVSLVLEQTDRSQGTFRCQILPESYEACRQAAYEAFAEAFRELLAQRLRMSDFTGDMDADGVEALVTETFGMSTVSYLMTCGPVLLPSLEELQSRYDGSGTYEAAEGILTRQFEADGVVIVRAESYIWKDSYLILSEENGVVMYTLKQQEDQ